MTTSDYLLKFYSIIQDKPSIGPTHIGLYMALLVAHDNHGCSNVIPINRAKIMKASKIHGIATYHKCMKDLIRDGFIKYTPSYHPAISSECIIVDLSKGA